MANSTSSLAFIRLHLVDRYDLPGPRSSALSRTGTCGSIAGCEGEVVSYISGTFCTRAWVPKIDGGVQDFCLPLDCTDAILLRHTLIILHRNSASIVSMLEYVFLLRTLSGLH